jgi:1-acyl-sn-glycerol-3-phosphate acyltransferase
MDLLDFLLWNFGLGGAFPRKLRFMSVPGIRPEDAYPTGGAMGQQIAGRSRDRRQQRFVEGRPFLSRWLVAILSPLHAIFMRRYFRIEVSGEHNIPSSGPFLLAPTHRSRWDAFLLYCAATRRQLYFLSSHDELVGLQGWFMSRLGSFPINVKRPGPSTIRSCSELISLGEALVIFPEGDLFYYGPGEVHPLKPGAAWLALAYQRGFHDVNLRIIPVRLVYGDRILRAGSRVKILVGEPISVADYAALPSKEGMFALTSALRSVLGDVVNHTGSAESLRNAISERKSSNHAGGWFLGRGRYGRGKPVGSDHR